MAYDALIVLVILGFLGLIIWSRVMGQKVIDTLREIRDFTKETFKQDE